MEGAVLGGKQRSIHNIGPCLTLDLIHFIGLYIWALSYGHVKYGP